MCTKGSLENFFFLIGHAIHRGRAPAGSGTSKIVNQDKKGKKRQERKEKGIILELRKNRQIRNSVKEMR